MKNKIKQKMCQFFPEAFQREELAWQGEGERVDVAKMLYFLLSDTSLSKHVFHH